MPPIVRQQAISLGLSMAAVIASLAIGSLVHAAIGVSGFMVTTAMCGVLVYLILRYGPQAWR